jgi:hypothetical protein
LPSVAIDEYSPLREFRGGFFVHLINRDMKRSRVMPHAIFGDCTNIDNLFYLTILDESLGFFGRHEVLTIVRIGCESGETTDEDEWNHITIK